MRYRKNHGAMEPPDIRQITEKLLADPAHRIDENDSLARVPAKAADLKMIARWPDCSDAELISNNKI